MSKKSADTKIRRGSENVFADLKFPDPEIHLLKAQLMRRVEEIINERELTPIDAARIMGVSRPEVSQMLKGHFRNMPVERIMSVLTKLGCEVDIVVRPQGRRRAFSAIHLMPANCGRS